MTQAGLRPLDEAAPKPRVRPVNLLHGFFLDNRDRLIPRAS